VLADEHAGRFTRFCLVGASGVVVNMGVLALLVSLGGWAPVLAAPVATEAAILNNFALNDRWTFRDRRGTRRWFERALRYNGITIGGLAISVATLAVLPRLFGVHYLIANLIAIGAGVVWNYSMNSWLTWMGNPSARHGPAGITAF
jgi:dolichol-phosphate mannosyltransferase